MTLSTDYGITLRKAGKVEWEGEEEVLGCWLGWLVGWLLGRNQRVMDSHVVNQEHTHFTRILPSPLSHTHTHTYRSVKNTG